MPTASHSKMIDHEDTSMQAGSMPGGQPGDNAGSIFRSALQLQQQQGQPTADNSDVNRLQHQWLQQHQQHSQNHQQPHQHGFQLPPAQPLRLPGKMPDSFPTAAAAAAGAPGVQPPSPNWLLLSPQQDGDHVPAVAHGEMGQPPVFPVRTAASCWTDSTAAESMQWHSALQRAKQAKPLLHNNAMPAGPHPQVRQAASSEAAPQFFIIQAEQQDNTCGLHHPAQLDADVTSVPQISLPPGLLTETPRPTPLRRAAPVFRAGADAVYDATRGWPPQLMPPHSPQQPQIMQAGPTQVSQGMSHPYAVYQAMQRGPPARSPAEPLQPNMGPLTMTWSSAVQPDSVAAEASLRLAPLDVSRALQTPRVGPGLVPTPLASHHPPAFSRSHVFWQSVHPHCQQQQQQQLRIIPAQCGLPGPPVYEPLQAIQSAVNGRPAMVRPGAAVTRPRSATGTAGAESSALWEHPGSSSQLAANIGSTKPAQHAVLMPQSATCLQGPQCPPGPQPKGPAAAVALAPSSPVLLAPQPQPQSPTLPLLPGSLSRTAAATPEARGNTSAAAKGSPTTATQARALHRRAAVARFMTDLPPPVRFTSAEYKFYLNLLLLHAAVLLESLTV